MKAIRVQQFGDPEVLHLTEAPGLAPGPGQVVVLVRAAGVNPVETYIRSGKYAKLPPLPYTPGTDGAGVIEQLGAGVEGWQIGQRVYLAGSLSGTYAGQALCEPAHLHPLPDAVSFAQGAAMGIPYATREGLVEGFWEVALRYGTPAAEAGQRANLEGAASVDFDSFTTRLAHLIASELRR